MPQIFTDAFNWLQGDRGYLVIPMILALWIAWGDLRTRRIPNYLTVGTAAAGLAFNLVFHGWSGAFDGFLGLLMGFGFLILPYIWGGMGAGDVKALASLGAWLGPMGTLFLFCYMGIAGGLLALGVLVWKGLFWKKLQRGWVLLVNFFLCRPLGLMRAPLPPKEETPGIPYGVAIALGMAAFLGIGMNQPGL